MSAGPLSGVSILLVEDDDDGREVLELSLEHRGAIVRSTATADGALELFATAPPAVVITDIVMPGRDGLWLLQQVRGLAGTPSVPVIALTGRALRHECDVIRAAGFDAHLIKPVDVEDMVPVIAALLESPRPR